MDNETDVLEFDFPDYEEPYPPFPDVKVALFDKEDSYSRNRDIADKLCADRQKEEERRREDNRRAVLKKMERLNPAALRPKSKAAKAVPVIAAVLAITAMVATSLMSGGMTNSASYTESETAPAIVEIAQTAVSQTEYVPPEPFDENTAYSIDDAVVYSTGTMSYLFLPYHTWDGKITVNVTVRNLTEEKYKVMTKGFYLTDGEKRSYDHVTISYQRTGSSAYSYYYTEVRDITELNFDDSGECRFQLEVPMDWLEKDSQIYIGYDSGYLSGLPEDNVTENFETPIYYYRVSN